ncbi:MAG: hypothetical protein IT166_21390 [Bryobacterales bacterium]|nr:hypothetical protein [Bryobacterales bacterium]
MSEAGGFVPKRDIEPRGEPAVEIEDGHSTRIAVQGIAQPSSVRQLYSSINH